MKAAINNWKASVPTSWKGDDPCQNWEGVKCDSNAGVAELNLSNRGLIGPVPIEIGNLHSLVSLDIGNAINSSGPWNQVTSDFSGISSLANLKTLNASFNNLNNEFPMSVLQLTGLIELRLDNAGLTGLFPSGLSTLNNLQYLYLGNNSMTGYLPSELGSLTNLVELSLWGINFSSLIPTELGGLTNLKYLTLHSCYLFGSLPPAFQNLKSIERLFLYSNALTGPIPESWQNMENLQDLRLQHNYLTKSFPSWIENLMKLQNVDISYNYLYGRVPNISSGQLRSLNIGCNFFSGLSPANSSGTDLMDYPNCFDKESESDKRNECASFYSCTSFNTTVLIYGACPQCPVGQIFSDASSCVCSEVPANQGSRDTTKSVWIGKLAGSIVGTALFLFLGLMGIVVFKKWKHFQTLPPQKPPKSINHSKFSTKESQEHWEAIKGMQRFSLEELAKATSNFDSKNEIGVGGFGRVFYGLLENGKQVAIKRASASSKQGSLEFRNEVMLLSRLHHRNLVHLEGFCEEDELQILVYEFVPNGNLHTHLFQKEADHSFDWLRRLDVAVGIAQGLDYLHSFADPPVIHRDVKPSNILLDNNLVAKLADFGLSKSTLGFETHVSTAPAGTAGYIDPQYFWRRQLTTASDVYGFGVVLLELITGQKAIDDNRTEEHNLVEWVKGKLKTEGLASIVDPRLDGKYPKDIYRDVAQLAIDCASFNTNERPSMKTAVTILDACLEAARPRSRRGSMDCRRQDEKSHVQILEEEMMCLEVCEEITFNSTVSASKSAFRESALLPR